MVLDSAVSFTYKLGGLNFIDYGGRFQALRSSDRWYYLPGTSVRYVSFLKNYQPEQPVSAAQLKAWQNCAIQGMYNKEVYMVDEGKKRRIPNLETFTSLNFTMTDIYVIPYTKVYSIPTGLPMPNVSN